MGMVARLEQAIAEARRRGLEVRLEPLQGLQGGLCEMGRRRYVFIDLTASVAEQYEQVASALRLLVAEEHPSATTSPSEAA